MDVHHGDGAQAIFYDDPRVLTVSIHQYAPEIGFFPGTGGPHRAGRSRRRGHGRERPAAAGDLGDAAWLAAFRAVVPEAVRRFHPDVLVTQLGCDTHHTDPLAHLRLTTAAYRETAKELHALAHETSDGRWVATGGGGYQWARVVPRAWTIYFAEMADAQVPDQIPEGWLERVEFLPARGGAHHALRVPIASRGRGRGRARDRRGRASRGARRRARIVSARTKLICTLGPASATPKLVRALVEAGTSIFRINFSHGVPRDHARSVRLVREVEEQVDRPLAVLADLPGPKVRLGAVVPDPFRFKPGQRFTLRPGESRRRARRLDHVPAPRG